MASLPTTTIGDREIGRLICGSNPFMGSSYRSPAHNAWQERVMTPSRIAQLLEKCLDSGIDTMLGNYDDDDTIHRARQLCKKRAGREPQWIAYTHGSIDRQMESIDKLADRGPFAIYIQGGPVDINFQYTYTGALDLNESDTFDNVVPWLQRIRDHGCVPGLCSHHPRIIQLAEERDYGAEFYVTPLNFIDVYCHYAQAVATVNRIDKPFVAIKTLGGSAKVSPKEGFICAYTALKKSDAIAVGVENEESIEYDAKIAADILGWLDGKVM